MKKQKTKKINPVVAILMRRDGMERHQAEALLEECRESLEGGNYEAIAEYLGLEDDYIFDVLGY